MILHMSWWTIGDWLMKVIYKFVTRIGGFRDSLREAEVIIDV